MITVLMSTALMTVSTALTSVSAHEYSTRECEYSWVCVLVSISTHEYTKLMSTILISTVFPTYWSHEYMHT